MITLIHIGFNLMIYFIISVIAGFDIQLPLILLLISVELIDIDHIFTKPIYDSRRNSFKTHFFHKYWQCVLFFALVLLFFNPLFIFGLGLISHLFLDWIDVKLHKLWIL